MKQDIKTLQLSHLEKVHYLKNEVLILPVALLFDKMNVNKHWRNRFYSIFLFKEAKGSVIIDDHLYELKKTVCSSLITIRYIILILHGFPKAM